ncbi:DUF1963 domain-containing protein [Limnoglobus roseus]|uniref:TIGR02996 domain-containing protein n=1 Tax=Limnoglobus roseus TaxID=2598579 RepID=A0A5C1AK11_9BACT|nr:DUF1963 domain-containing protein [Limnoglobus roseus]QEL18032.1 TIGR02996 domain-containing protein [Limnoglobus roseus]
MNRRLFLASAPFLLGGCRDTRPAALAPPSVEDSQTRLARAAAFRVPSSAVRTTPKAPVDVVEQFPELKALLKVAVRLHPRFGDEPTPTESKLGGQFLWPAGEEWPRCPEYQIPMQPLLQLRLENAPAHFPFRPKTDLFQLFWTPKATKNVGPPHLTAIWRKIPPAIGPLAPPPVTDGADLGYVPLPCRFFIERVAEFPPVELMPAQMRTKVEVWKPPVDYATHLSTAPGTKAGGWPARADVTATCLTCVRPMDYLLTVDSCEWTAVTKARWKPAEDPDEDGYRCAAGLRLGRSDAAAYQIYICRRCEKWPLRAVMA